MDEWHETDSPSWNPGWCVSPSRYMVSAWNPNMPPGHHVPAFWSGFALIQQMHTKEREREDWKELWGLLDDRRPTHTHTQRIWLKTWPDYMCMDVFNVFHFAWSSGTNHNTGWGHILAGSEPVHSTMLTFYTLTSDGVGVGVGVVCSSAFSHTVILGGVNGGEQEGNFFF